MSDEKSNFDTCLLTGKKGKFVDSHILPRSFYENSRSRRAETFKIISSSQDSYPRRNRIGLYDRNLVTSDGEYILQRYDDYAAKVLLPAPYRSQYFRDDAGFIAKQKGVKLAYQIQSVDYPKLKLFFLSLLWRISASTRDEFKRIKLQCEDQLRELILAEKPGDHDEFSVIIYRYTGRLAGCTLLPHRRTLQNTKFIATVCGSLAMHIKIDEGPTPEPLASLQLQPNKPLTILTMPFDGSPDHDRAKEIVNRHRAQLQKKWL